MPWQSESPPHSQGSPLLYPWQSESPPHFQGSPIGSDLDWLGDEPHPHLHVDPFNQRNSSRNRSSKEYEQPKQEPKQEYEEDKKGVVIILGHSDFGGEPKEESCNCNMPTHDTKVRTFLIGALNCNSLMFRDPEALEQYFTTTYAGIFDMEDDDLIELLTKAKQNYRTDKTTMFNSFQHRFSSIEKDAYFNSKVLMNTDLNSFCERIWVFHMMVNFKFKREGLVLLMTKDKGNVKFTRLYETNMSDPSFKLKKSILIRDMRLRGIETLTIIDHACTVYDKDMCREFKDALRNRRFGGKSKQIKRMNQSKKKRRKTKRKRRNQIKRIV